MIMIDASLQILLPCDILGLFLLFILDQQKKVVSILDPLSIPTFGKHILKTMVNDLNLALQTANPAFKDDILIWGCKVPAVSTNSYRYESCQYVTILIDSFSLHVTFHTCSPLSGYLVFNLMHSWHDGTLHFPVPKVTIDTMLISTHITHVF